MGISKLHLQITTKRLQMVLHFELTCIVKSWVLISHYHIVHTVVANAPKLNSDVPTCMHIRPIIMFEHLGVAFHQIPPPIGGPSCLFNLSRCFGCFSQNAEWRSVLCHDPCPSSFVHHKVSGSNTSRTDRSRTTEFYTDVHANLLYNLTGYDVASCFRSAL